MAPLLATLFFLRFEIGLPSAAETIAHPGNEFLIHRGGGEKRTIMLQTRSCKLLQGGALNGGLIKLLRKDSKGLESWLFGWWLGVGPANSQQACTDLSLIIDECCWH